MYSSFMFERHLIYSSTAQVSAIVFGTFFVCVCVPFCYAFTHCQQGSCNEKCGRPQEISVSPELLPQFHCPWLGSIFLQFVKAQACLQDVLWVLGIKVLASVQHSQLLKVCQELALAILQSEDGDLLLPSKPQEAISIQTNFQSFLPGRVESALDDRFCLSILNWLLYLFKIVALLGQPVYSKGKVSAVNVLELRVVIMQNPKISQAIDFKIFFF